MAWLARPAVRCSPRAQKRAPSSCFTTCKLPSWVHACGGAAPKRAQRPRAKPAPALPVPAAALAVDVADVEKRLRGKGQDVYIPGA
eukprot:8910992-Alexandrium_andersonii.AAC.1